MHTYRPQQEGLTWGAPLTILNMTNCDSAEDVNLGMSDNRNYIEINPQWALLAI